MCIISGRRFLKQSYKNIQLYSFHPVSVSARLKCGPCRMITLNLQRSLVLLHKERLKTDICFTPSQRNNGGTTKDADVPPKNRTRDNFRQFTNATHACHLLRSFMMAANLRGEAQFPLRWRSRENPRKYSSVRYRRPCPL